MDVLALNRLARLLREVALKASQDGQELPISASELAVIENVARHPDITISEISHNTGLAQCSPGPWSCCPGTERPAVKRQQLPLIRAR